MKKATLLILAAGIGSRYGGNKQIDSFGPNGETIIEYSVYDAIKAGFDKVVFIIREELKNEFHEIFGSKLKGKIEYELAIQTVNYYIPSDLDIGERTKPWGTGHAMLCAKEFTDSPFAVINADDFYGYGAYETMAKFLKEDTNENQHAMVGYLLKNTLSENGTVSRGICKVNEKQNLDYVIEHTKIKKTGENTVADFENGEKELSLDNIVSMNFWGFKPNVFQKTQEWFEEYARKNVAHLKAEFYIPLIVTKIIEEKIGTCKVYDTESPWFGVTYPEDKPEVKQKLTTLVNNGEYPKNLWS